MLHMQITQKKGNMKIHFVIDIYEMLKMCGFLNKCVCENGALILCFTNLSWKRSIITASIQKR